MVHIKTQLVERILAYDLAIGNLERQVKELSKLRAVDEKQLVEMMDDDGEKGFETDDGKRVVRDDKMILTVSADQKDNWFDWIDSIGRSDLIKTDINKNSLNAIVRAIIRGKDRDHQLPGFLDLSRDLFFIPRVAIKVGAKSLRKLASESSLDGSDSDGGSSIDL